MVNAINLNTVWGAMANLRTAKAIISNGARYSPVLLTSATMALSFAVKPEPTPF
jgi:hypothetical protein